MVLDVTARFDGDAEIFESDPLLGSARWTRR
jgi:hypothetical protein